MKYGQALNIIKTAVPQAQGRTLDLEARRAFRHRQLEAARVNPKGWPWQSRVQWVQNAGGYETGTVAATQDSRDLTLTGGTFPDPCAGWIIGFSKQSTELYKIESRYAASAVKINRPFEGDTDGALEYTMYDPYCRAPSDLYAWKALVLEADGNKLLDSQMGMVRGAWPKQIDLDEGYIACVAEPSDTAGYETGTVTVAKGSPAVTGAATSFPEWIAGHHFALADEGVLYKIKSWGGVSALTLDRAYGGDAAAAGLSYAIDPAGAIQIEVTHPRVKQYALKIDYFAEPRQHMNDSDQIEGDEAYAAALIDLATADVLMSNTDPERMSEGMMQELYQKAKTYEARGNRLLASMLQSNAPQPEDDGALIDIRYSYGRAGRWSAMEID